MSMQPLADSEIPIATQQAACALFAHAYKVGIKNLPDGQSALEFTRSQLDRLGIGADLKAIPWGRKSYKLPPSKLAAEDVPA